MNYVEKYKKAIKIGFESLKIENECNNDLETEKSQAYTGYIV